MAQFVERSLPPNIILTVKNEDGRTAQEVVNQTHKALNDEARKWLENVCQSCSVIAALTATAAFATVTTIPEKVKGDRTLEVFAIASLAALTFSIASLIVFLALIIYDHHQAGSMARHLIVGINSLIIAIASMLISFFASLSLHLHDLLPDVVAFHAYTIPACLLMALFIRVFLPLCEYTLKIFFSKVPLPAYKRHVSLISTTQSY